MSGFDFNAFRAQRGAAIPDPSIKVTSTTAPGAKAGHDTALFLRAVLPPEGHGLYCIGYRPHGDKSGMRHEFVPSVREVVQFVEQLGAGHDVYIAPATFGGPRRVAAGAQHVRALFVDLDAGPGKGFPTKDAAQAAALDLSDRLKFPRPSLIDSGNGFHAYWLFDSPVSVAEWLRLAEALKAAAAGLDVPIDPVRTADAASLMRAPGTMNGKDPSKPRQTCVIQHGAAKPVAFYAQALSHWVGRGPRVLTPTDMPVLGGGTAPSPADVRNVNADVLAVPGQRQSLAKIADKCAAVAEMRDSEGNVPEPLWRLGLGLAKHCDVDGVDLAHAWSQGYDGYSHDETQAKMDRWTVGPPLCTTFAEHSTACQACPHRDKITTPASLGRVEALTEAATAEPGSQEPATKAGAKNEAEAALNALNARYFLAAEGGQVSIYHEGWNYEFNRPAVEPMTRADFLLKHEALFHTHVDKDGGVKRVPTAQVWLRSPSRRQYAAVVMSPEGTPEGTYNLWRGWAVKPTQGDPTPMLEHVYMLAGTDRAAADYVVKWFAFKVQNPGKRPETAAVLRGGEGTGKGILLRAMLDIFGQHGLHISNGKLMTGDFNGHLRNCLFLYADEATWGGDRSADGPLKALITEPTLTINAKYRTAIATVNRIAVVMSSNHDWLVPASADSRRYFVLDVASTRQGDGAYFKGLTAWLKDGGLGVWLDYLLKLDITGFDPRQVPHTAGLDRQRVQSLPILSRWVLDCLSNGRSPAGGEWADVPLQALCADAARQHAEFVRQHGGHYSRAADTTAIGAELRRVFDCGPAVSTAVRQVRGKAWRLPPLGQARALALRAFGLQSFEWET